jgi:hypothetical protein
MLTPRTTLLLSSNAQGAFSKLGSTGTSFGFSEETIK